MNVKILKKDPQAFLKLIKSDIVDIKEAIETYLMAGDFEGKEKVFYEIVKKLKEKKLIDIEPELLRNLFEGKESVVFDLYRNKYVETMFPVALKDKGKIVHAMVFKAEETYTNFPSVENYIKEVEKIVNKKLGVIFDDGGFEGNSFQLAIAIAALVKRLPENLAFTGALDEKGNLMRNLDYLHIKQKVCDENELKLISAFDIDNVFKLKEFFESKQIHIPVLIALMKADEPDYIKASYEELKYAVQERYPMEFVEIFEKIYETNKIFVEENGLTDNWQSVLKKVGKLIYKIVSNNGIPHIAIMGPATFAMALGIYLGLQNPVVFYHKDGKEYKPVLDLTDNLRKIKNIVGDYKHVKYSIMGDGENCAFALNFASHNLIDGVRRFIDEKQLNSKIALIEPKFGKGNIQLDDWSEIISEVMSITQNIYFETSFKNVYFFISAPLPIAFGLGLSYGDFAKGSIFHYDKNLGSYIEVFKIEEIRKN